MPGSDRVTSVVNVLEVPGRIGKIAPLQCISPLMNSRTPRSILVWPASRVIMMVTGWPGSTESGESDRLSEGCLDLEEMALRNREQDQEEV